MKKVILLCLFACLNSLAAQDYKSILTSEPAQQLELKGKYHRPAKSDISRYSYLRQSNIDRRPYDVLSYNIFVDWFAPLSASGVKKSDRAWKGENEITLKSELDGLSNLEFDDFLLDIDSVLVNGVRVDGSFNVSGGLLNVPLAQPANSGDVLVVKIFYNYSNDTDFGFYLYPKGLYVGKGPHGDTVRVEERLAYTMAEPEEGRYWLPSNDRPYDKASLKVAVRVPLAYTAVSNGLLARIDTVGDARTFYWEDETPISTYLIAITASIFGHYSDKYTRVSNPSETVNVDYYVWPNDVESDATDGSKYNAKNAFARTPEMMEYYSREFVEYPFKKYGMVAVQPFGFGGMEHQTMTTITRTWLRGYDESGIAHELAHQWLGDLVTCATWYDLWLNEGGATWSEALWAEYNNGYEAYLENMMYNRLLYLWSGGKSLPSILEVDPEEAFGQYSVLVYQKASWVYHMLREAIGKDEFAQALREYLNQFAYKAAETSDFFDFLKAKYPNLPFSLDDFSDQWLGGRGFPSYKLNTVSMAEGSKYNVAVNISQHQSGIKIPEVYKMPLRIKFYESDASTPHIETVYNSQRSETFNFSLDFAPQYVFIDTTAVLCATSSNTVSAENEASATVSGVQVCPNPVQSEGYTILKTFIAAPGEGSIEVFNAGGQRVITSREHFNTVGNSNLILDTSELPSGVYFVRFAINGEIKTARFTVVR